MKRARVQFVPAIISTYGELSDFFAGLLKRIAVKVMETNPYPLTRDPDAWIAAYKLHLMQE